MYAVIYETNLQEFKTNQSFHYKRTPKKALALQGLQINENYKTATISMSS